MFTILDTSDSELQLSVLEALYITRYQSAFCKPNEFYNLLLFNPTDNTATKPELKKKALQVNVFFPFLGFSFFCLVVNYLDLFLVIACLSQSSLTRRDRKTGPCLELMIYVQLKVILTFQIAQFIIQIIFLKSASES